MGTINAGILGGFRGKVGSVVGSGWKGIDTMKAMPASVSNPQTAAQVEQRARMTGIVEFAKSILSTWIKPLWDRFAIKQSGYNAFVSNNIALFVAGVITDVSSLVMSIGNMSSTAIETALSVENTEAVDVAWVLDVVGFHLSTDTVFAVVIDNEGIVLGVSNLAIRSGLQIAIPLNRVTVEAESLHVFLAFKRSNGLYVSLASYKECVVSAA